MKCFYHGDLDGKCAGAIVYAFTPCCSRSDFYEVDYGRDFPFDVIEDGERVFIVDWSLNQIEGGWEKLMAITNDIVWIDHHKSALEGCNFKFKGIQNTGEAGCVLTWQFFKGQDAVPFGFDLVGDYDIWRFKYGDDTVAFQNAMKLYDTHPTSSIWRDVYSSQKTIDKLLGEGYIIKRSLEMSGGAKVKKLGFTTEFEGHKAVACNAFAGSKLFDSIETDADLKITFRHDGTQFTVSVYSSNNDIDCSEIAKKYGGGGHKGAAGFQCDAIPFKRLGGLNES